MGSWYSDVACQCKEGYRTNNTSCEKQYSGDVDEKCKQDQCAECIAGYHHDMNSECVLNTCDCEHGNGATGIDCEVNGSKFCKDCDPEFTLSAGKCTNEP